MRQSEIMTLEWDQIDLDRCAITLYETKNGETRVVPIVGLAKTLLEEPGKVRSLHEIAVGHKTLAMVQRYAHLSEQHTMSVVERMNNVVFGDQ